jgi:hypothetical protein
MVSTIVQRQPYGQQYAVVIYRNLNLNRNQNTEISVKSEPIPKPKDRTYRNRNRKKPKFLFGRTSCLSSKELRVAVVAM